jgi:hypothetical protein
MKTTILNITIASLALIFVGCDKAKLVNYDLKSDPIVSIVDVEDVVEGQDLVRVTTKSGMSATVDRALIPMDKDLDGDGDKDAYIPKAEVEESKLSATARAVAGKIPVIGPYAEPIAGVAMALWIAWERRRRQQEINARLRGETELKNTELLTMAIATGVEIMDNKEVKEAISKRMPNKLIDKFDSITEGIRDGSNK